MQRSTWEQWRGSVDRWEEYEEELDRQIELEAQRIQDEEDLKAEKARELAEVYEAQERSRLAGRTILPRFLQQRILDFAFSDVYDSYNEGFWMMSRRAQKVSYLWMEGVNLMLFGGGGIAATYNMPRRPLPIRTYQNYDPTLKRNRG
jgi:hypothetical protein